MSDCYCDIGDPPVFYFISRPRARKPHKCYECDMEIRPGETYERVRAKWERDISIIKTCPDCIAIRDALEEMPCFCWLHGSLLEDISNQFQFSDFSPGLRFNLLRELAKHRLRVHLRTN